MGNQFQCYNLMYSDDLRNVFPLNGMQITVIQILGPIGLFFCTVNMVMILLIKSLKQPPSDILFFISLLTTFKICIYYITIIYNEINPICQPIPRNFDSFCLATGVVDVFCEMSKFIATIIFCVYYLAKIKNPLKAWISQHKELYIISFFLVITATCIIFFTNNIGISIYGYCSIKFSQVSQFIQLLFTLGFITTLLIASVMFLKYLQKVANNDLTFRKYFKYYFKFLIIFSLSQLIIVFSHAAIAFTCSLNSGLEIFNVCLVLDKVAIVLTPIFIFIVLVNHPRFKKVMLIKVIRVIAKKWQLLTHTSTRSGEDGYMHEDIILSTNRNAVLIELNTLSGIDTGYVSQLKNKNRACFLTTILGCIVVQELQDQEMLDRESALVDLQQRDSQINFKPLLNYHTKSKFTLSPAIFDFYLEIFLRKLPAIYISFTSYCSNVFQTFKRMDEISSFRRGLLPELNEQQIIKDANNDGDGGRSGQFFFFNYDRSFILKTVNCKQKGIILNKLEQFYQHFINQPQSFIVKIYSLFTTKNLSTQEESHFMLMGNILKSIDRSYVLKVYDLKGSSHHREVLSKTKCHDEMVVGTLKDLDFIKIEEKIWITLSDSQEIKRTLIKDAQFLCRNKLIDYSLLVIKIKYKQLEENDCDTKPRYFKSTKQFDTAYVFGIIDYLETWNIKKIGEKWYKSIFAKSSTISSQNPKFYYKRFTKQVINDFFP